MNTDLLNILKQIVAERGDSILSEPKIVSAFLSDLARDVPKPQKYALIKCLEHKFAQTLKNVDKAERANCKQKLAKKLNEEEGLDIVLCGNTIELLTTVLVSRRVVLEDERNKQRSNVLDTLEKNQVRKGIVKNITEFGAFIDLGGVDGLLHITDMSYKRINDPKEIVQLGQEVEVVILDFNDKKERISLGIKQLHPHPWESIESELLPGAKVTGEVRSILTFGAFVDIKEGVDGLIHISDMSWTKKIEHPSEMIKKGDKVECVVLAVDSERRRISLSMKHLEDDPWDSVENDFQVGAEVKGKIIRFIERGAAVELTRGFEGLVPVSKLGIDYIKIPAEAFKIGDEIPAIVTELNHSQRTIYLSAADYFKNHPNELTAWKTAHRPDMNSTKKKKTRKGNVK